MVYILIPLFFLFCVTCAHGKAPCNDIEGYFWLDFTGEIPKYALPAGRDVNGNPIYFGQVVDPSDRRVVPCKIYINDRRVYYELHTQERNATQNIKIFCTQHPEQFEWIKTNNEDIDWLTDKNLITGGWEPYSTTYIGRARQGGEVLVGKIIGNIAEPYKGLHVTTGGHGIRHTTYEVLSYNPKRSSNRVCSDLDGYFWVDYTGEIPKYALAGGKDIFGKPIYFGQVIDTTDQRIIPAMLYSNDHLAYYELNKQELNTTSNIKIFCTQHPENFEWFKTNNDDVELLTDKQLIIGGWEPVFTTYIGRARYRGTVFISKVIADIPERAHAGLHIPTEGTGIRMIKFEVLTYNPKVGANAVCRGSEGYYWRDYKGIIPKDAVEGVYNPTTDAISYIGQTHHNGLIVPGIINGITKQMTYELDLQIHEGRNVTRILCSTHPEHFEWTSTKNINFKNPGNRQLVLGGDNAGIELYIGGVYVNDEYLIGTVMSSDLETVLFAPGKDGKVLPHTVFEVLTFNEVIQPSQTDKLDDRIASVTNKGSQNCKRTFINIYF